MQYDDTVDDSRRHLRSALELIGKHAASADPVNYCIWYEYASGRNGKLNAAIDRHLQTDDVVSNQLAQKLFSQYIADSQLKIADIVRERLKILFADIMVSIKSTSRQFSQSENNLDTINGALGATLSEADMDKIVGRIKDEIRRLESSSFSLKEQLQQATNEIEELKTAMARYRNEALKDALTRIDNRRGFEEKLTNAIDQSKTGGTSLCLIIADIDHFKRINDTHGHLVGDNVLRIVAETIKDCIKGKDLVARIGGEEFAILLQDTPFDGAMKLADNMRLTFEKMDLKKKNSGENLGRISLSFGVARYKNGEDSKAFVQRADDALYRSKRAGRNRVTGAP